jgi:hypothetical protein
VGSTACSAGVGTAAWEALVRTALLPLHHPLLFMISPAFAAHDLRPYDPPSPTSTCATCITTLNSDCGDAAINSFHRDAVHIFLPYITDVDALSWWSSQAILFHLKKGCLAGHGGWLTGIDPAISQHVSYPHGRPVAEELAAVRSTYPGLYDSPLHLPSGTPAWSMEFEQGDCNPSHHSVTYLHQDAANASTVQASRSWLTSPAFLQCTAAALPRFCAFAKNVTQPVQEAGTRGPWRAP